jgi:hypothetical protein
MECSAEARLVTREVLNTAALDRKAERQRIVALFYDVLTAEAALI